MLTAAETLPCILLDLAGSPSQEAYNTKRHYLLSKGLPTEYVGLHFLGHSLNSSRSYPTKHTKLQKSLRELMCVLFSFQPEDTTRSIKFMLQLCEANFRLLYPFLSNYDLHSLNIGQSFLTETLTLFNPTSK